MAVENVAMIPVVKTRNLMSQHPPRHPFQSGGCNARVCRGTALAAEADMMLRADHGGMMRSMDLICGKA